VFTEDELEIFDGVRSVEIYLAYGGEVFDVSSGAAFYGPGTAYAKFAGRACTRGVVMPSLEDDDVHDGIDDFAPDETAAALDHWRAHYRNKYPRVGALAPDTPDERMARLRRRREAAAAAEAERRAAAAAAAKDAQKRAISPAELAAHDASSTVLWLCAVGTVYDVSKSRYLYGAGSPRSMYAGKCVGRALAKGSTKPEDLNDDVADLDDAERAALDERATYFLTKFPPVGVLQPDAEGGSEPRPQH
jgi:membrane-associated progesterone receptor component